MVAVLLEFVALFRRQYLPEVLTGRERGHTQLAHYGAVLGRQRLDLRRVAGCFGFTKLLAQGLGLLPQVLRGGLVRFAKGFHPLLLRVGEVQGCGDPVATVPSMPAAALGGLCGEHCGGRDQKRCDGQYSLEVHCVLPSLVLTNPQSRSL